MQVKQEDYDVGVIVGRFQVDELHVGHRQLIEDVRSEHDKVIIFLGLAPVMNTINNPLDFETRKQMILAEYPDVTVLGIKDVAENKAWSQTLDARIGEVVSPTQSVVLYGGRESFIEDPITGEPIYQGEYMTRELVSDVIVRGTDIRKRLAKQTKALPEFRHGVIWASANRFPTVFTTVDVAIFRDDYTKILLGRKKEESKYRLIGGFADPRDSSFEHTAVREMGEETSLYVLDGASSALEYLGSYNIDDWRYRGEVDCIRTMLYAVSPLGGPTPGDDIHELKWFDVDKVEDQLYMVVDHHHEILGRALEHAREKQLAGKPVEAVTH